VNYCGGSSPREPMVWGLLGEADWDGEDVSEEDLG